MTKKNKILFFLVLALFVSGCANLNIGNNAKYASDSTQYHVGTRGLVMNFVNRAPPAKIYDGEPLEIMVEYTNKGAHDIVNGRMYVSGFDQRYFDIVPDEITFDSTGKSIYNPDGLLSNLVTFVDSRVEVPEGADSLVQNIKVSACYNYETIATLSACIDPNPRSLSEKVCAVAPITLSGGQGGPVSVTRIQEDMGQDRVTFKIDFENLGGGMVFDVHKGLTDCHVDLEYVDVDIIDLTVRLSDITLQCEPNNGLGVRMINGKGFAYCYYEGNLGDDAYLTQLRIELRYAYRNSVTKSVEIVNI
ncbi:hypothetical protein GOV05_04420 [Candidatus Woesearchaeota archaeon]|nr:hypothetical protein [Candidatus Woesearchaeota archaeon]